MIRLASQERGSVGSWGIPVGIVALAAWGMVGMFDMGDNVGTAILDCSSHRNESSASGMVFEMPDADNLDVDQFMAELRSGVDAARNDPYQPKLLLRNFRDEGFNPNPIDALLNDADDGIELDDIQAGEILCRNEDSTLEYTVAGDELMSDLGDYAPRTFDHN